MLRRIAIGLPVFVVLLLVGIPGWIAMNRHDMPSPNDADLEVLRLDLAPEENGYTHFEAAGSLRDWPDDWDCKERVQAIRARESFDREWLEEMLARNRAALDALERSIEAPSFQLPLETPATVADGEEVATQLMYAHCLTKLSGAASRLHLEDGDPQGAIERAILGMRAGRRLSDARGINRVGLMVALSLQRLSLSDLEALMREMQWTPVLARSVLAELEANRMKNDSWSRAWSAQYQFFKQVILDAAATGDPYAGFEDQGMLTTMIRMVPRDYLWQPNRTLAGLADQYREQLRKSTMSCRDGHAAPIGRQSPKLEALTAMVGPNPIGSMLNLVARPDRKRFDLKRCHLATRISLVQVAIALKARSDAGAAPPDSLDAVVPEYLRELPLDHFDGAPLRYSREERRIHSVGDDYQAGSPESRVDGDPSDASEPTLSVAFGV